MTYTQWLEEWLSMIKPTVKLSTFKQYSYFVERVVLPDLGGYDLNGLSLRVIQSYVTKLTNHYSPRSTKSIVSVIKRSLQSAEDANVLETNMSRRVQYKCCRSVEHKYLSLREQRTLENCVYELAVPKFYGIILSLYTGLRIGELLALRWINVDMSNEIIHVQYTSRDSYTDRGYVKVLDVPKTATSRRDIPIPPNCMELLSRMKSQSRGEFIIYGRYGRPVSIRSYQKSFALLLQRIKLPPMGFHSLRHTFATRALEVGMDVKTLSEILGHSSASVTLNVYAHTRPEHMREMLNKLSRIMD